jgi:hypothetical protein
LLGVVLVSFSHVEASSSYGSGIGTGLAYEGLSRIEGVTVWNSTIITRSLSGSGIGTGQGYSSGGNASIGFVLISSSHVEASSNSGSPVGTGSVRNGTTKINSIAIVDSTINASGPRPGMGIGTGLVQGTGKSEADIISIPNSTIWSNSINASTILISSSLAFIANDAPLFATAPLNNGSFDLVIGYSRRTFGGMERLSLLEGPFLHIGSLEIPQPDSRRLAFCIEKADYARCFDDTMGRIRSVVVRSSRDGVYSFPGWVDGIAGNFAWDCIVDLSVDLNCSPHVLFPIARQRHKPSFPLRPHTKFPGTTVANRPPAPRGISDINKHLRG